MVQKIRSHKFCILNSIASVNILMPPYVPITSYWATEFFLQREWAPKGRGPLSQQNRLESILKQHWRKGSLVAQ